MPLCQKCGFENYPHTKYCQKCGSSIVTLTKDKFFHFFLGGIARICNPSYTIAPLIGLQLDNTNQISNSPSYKNVPVVPLEDGSWYCPDCGEHNNKNRYICYGCGRDFIAERRILHEKDT